MYLFGHDNRKSGNGKHESVQEPEDNAEAPNAPMVPGLQPPSPRPMVHDPLDRQENEPERLTAAELARWVIQFFYCLFFVRLQNKALHVLLCTPEQFDVKSLVSCLLTVSQSKVRVNHAARTADDIRPLHISACTYTAFCRDTCSPIHCGNFLWVCMQHLIQQLPVHSERSPLCIKEASQLCCRQQELMQHKEQEFAIANEAMLADFMERVDQIADVVGQTELGHPDGNDCAGKLRLAVDDLRDVSCLPELPQQWSRKEF